MMKVTFLFHLTQGQEALHPPTEAGDQKAGIVLLQCSMEKSLVKGKFNVSVNCSVANKLENDTG